MNISSSKAVISGGVSGLGLAVAQRIVADGGQVFLLDINEEAGQRVTRELGANAHFAKTDVRSEAEVEAVLDRASEQMDGINVAVSCAGVIGAGRVLGREAAMPLAHFANTVEINLVGSFNLAKGAAAHIQHSSPNADGERGVIINTASVAAYEGQIGQAAYSASKAGIIGMTLPMARELTRFGIRVMTIAPGVFLTPMVDGMPDEMQLALGAAVPFPQRLGEPAEFADLMATILGNSYLNGSTIRLDGAIRLQPK